MEKNNWLFTKCHLNCYKLRIIWYLPNLFEKQSGLWHCHGLLLSMIRINIWVHVVWQSCPYMVRIILWWWHSREFRKLSVPSRPLRERQKCFTSFPFIPFIYVCTHIFPFVKIRQVYFPAWINKFRWFHHHPLRRYDETMRWIRGVAIPNPHWYWNIVITTCEKKNVKKKIYRKPNKSQINSMFECTWTFC